MTDEMPPLPAGMAANFPGHTITAERTADNRIRYTAHNRDDDAHPRVVITHDLAELHILLGQDGTSSSA
jgi:hypothetical protein